MGTVKTMLHTQRLILRKWTQADADSLFEYASSPEVGPVAAGLRIKARRKAEM